MANETRGRTTTMTISDVIFESGAYTVYDENSREVNRIYAGSYNGMCGFGKNFIVFEDGDYYYAIVNAETGNEIERWHRSHVGNFKHANGRLMVFEDGSRIVVYEVSTAGIAEISHR
jgi:hypothetical protein